VSLGTIRKLEVHEVVESTGQSQFATLQLSPEQQSAENVLIQRIRSKQPVTVLAGFAGTGKSTLTGFLARKFEDMKLRVAYAAPTGKASGVLRRSLAANGVTPGFCGTTHRLIYKPVIDSAGNVTGWTKTAKIPWDVIVVDEASMLSSELQRDLASFNIPLLYVGDHGQLPPVGEEVGLMSSPHVRLETVLRQALQSPIIALSFLIRAGGDWKKFVAVNKKDELSRLDAWSYLDYCTSLFDGFQTRRDADDPMIVCRTNALRNDINNSIRIGLGLKEKVVVGERVICLKNSYMNESMIANGFRGIVDSLAYARNINHIGANIHFLDEGVALDRALMNTHQFGRSATFKMLDDVPGGPGTWEDAGMLFDYGYALTCHKAQGSQADHAVVKMDRGGMPDDEWRRWAYTATTRAQKKLTLIY
jgi:exodeoxyribonuclease-5